MRACRLGKAAEKLRAARVEMHAVATVVEATSAPMSSRDKLRPLMDIIYKQVLPQQPLPQSRLSGSFQSSMPCVATPSTTGHDHAHHQCMELLCTSLLFGFAGPGTLDGVGPDCATADCTQLCKAVSDGKQRLRS